MSENSTLSRPHSQPQYWLSDMVDPHMRILIERDILFCRVGQLQEQLRKNKKPDRVSALIEELQLAQAEFAAHLLSHDT